MLGNKRDSTEFDNDNEVQKDRSHNSNCMQLEADLQEFQRREKAFLQHLFIKDSEIRSLQLKIKEGLKSIQERKYDCYLDPLLTSEFKILKNLISEKDLKIRDKENELNSLQVTQNNPQFKRLLLKCRDLHKENMDLYNDTIGGTLENLKFENGLEKSHIDQLMLKLKEKEEVNKDWENEISEMNEVVIALNKKIKDAEERTLELEKELKSSKK